MTTYQLFWFDQNRHMIKSRHVDCQTDHAAITLADQQVGGYARVEIWDGKRPVCIGGPPSASAIRRTSLSVD